MFKLTLFVLMLAAVGCKTPSLYCVRIGEEYPGHFLCTDKDETFVEELNLDKLPNGKVPQDWDRVRLSFSRDGEKTYIENYGNRWNNGKLVHPEVEVVEEDSK